MNRALNAADNHRSLDATVAAALRDVGLIVQSSRSTQSARFDRYGLLDRGRKR
jgi:hypothetical protein